MKRMFAVALAVLALGLSACTDVPAGNVGVKIYKFGGNKGVDHEVVGTGRYWLGMNEEIHLFPTFEQNPKYTASDNDHGAPFNFQTAEGMTAEADFSVTYNITSDKVATVFQKYRLGVEEINRGPLRNLIRDAVQEVASSLKVEDVYGAGKVKMVDDIQKLVAERAKGVGLTVTQVSLLGSIRLPPNVTQAINMKMEATQRAQQRENELREAEAQAKKEVAAAEGEALKQKALAEGRAGSILVEAQAQAKANRILSESLTSSLIEYRRIEKWNGQMPQVTTGSATALISMGKTQ